MRKIFTLFFVLIGFAVAAWPANYIGQEPKSGNTYYLWNAGQQQFLSASNGELTLGGSPLAVTITANESSDNIYGQANDGYVKLSTATGNIVATPFQQPRSDGQGKYSDWIIQPIGTDNNYNLACRYRTDGNTSAYLYYSQITENLTMTYIRPAATLLGGQWRFVSTEDLEQIITLDEASTQYVVPTLNEGSTSAVVHLKRTFTLGSWNSFCVPFDISDAQLRSQFGSDVKLARLSGVNSTTLLFTSTAEGVVAGTPYIVLPTKGPAEGTDYYEFTGVDRFVSEPTQVTQTASQTDGGATVSFIGSFSQTTAPASVYVLRKNLIYHLSKAMSMKGFRGYIEETTSTGAKGISSWALDDQTTDISAVSTDASAGVKAYNLQGQRVNTKASLPHGVYIVAGKKVIK